MAAFSLDDCNVHINMGSRNDSTSVFRHVVWAVNHPILGKDIALIRGILINRRPVRGRFLEIMDEESQELHEMSLALFDKFGHLKPELVDDEYHKGSGCWGREMDNTNAMIIYVDSVEVKPAFRRKGLGSWTLQKLMESPHVCDSDFVLAWPTPIDRTNSRAEWNTAREGIIAFYRKNGFRRMGRTSFFAYTKNEQHPSHQIAAEKDADAYPRPPHADAEEDRRAAATAFVREFAFAPPDVPRHTLQMARNSSQRYPLHHTISSIIVEGMNLPGMDFHRVNTDFAAVVKDAYFADPTSVRQQDEFGLTPLHVAATFHNVSAVQALLDLPAESGVSEDIRRRDNTDGLTPLDACERQMRSTREFSEALLPYWNGYSESALKVVLLLRRALGENISEDDDTYVKARKWGCTCGKCVEGFLSPRMSYRLGYQAGVTYTLMNDAPPPFTGNAACSPEYSSTGIGLDHIPAALRGVINSTFYEQYCMVFLTIAVILMKEPVRAPTPEIVRRETGTTISYFLAHGGLIEYALDCVLSRAREESPLGDGEWDDMIKDDLKWASLPHCANDLEFQLVRNRLGLDPTKKWGPYFDFDEFAEDEEEDEEEILDLEHWIDSDSD